MSPWRIRLLAMVISLAAWPAAAGRAVPPAAVAAGPRMVADFMNAEANRLLDRRDAEIAAITTPEQVCRRQERMRKWFAEKLGPMPPKATRPPWITGGIDGDGYRVQKVI